MKKVVKVFFNKSGFTLIEVLAAIIILSVVSVPIFYYFNDTQKKVIQDQRIVDAQNQANSAIKLILDDLRKVDTATITTNASAGGTNSDTSTVCVIPASESDLTSGRIEILESDGTQIDYGVFSKTLYRLVKNNVVTDNVITNFQPNTTGNLTSGKVVASNVQSFMPVQNTNADTQASSYTISVILAPPKVGSIAINPVSATINFTPRFEMNIR